MALLSIYTAQLLIVAWLLSRAFFNPLGQIPGPFWAKLTHLWKAYHMYKRDLPQAILKAHEKYGPVIRIGPNDVNFQSRDAIDPIYKAGRSMPKTIFYDAFTAIQPNLFSTRDEAFHTVRRRQMAHSFSTATVLKFESTFNKHLDRLFHNVEQSVGKTFDMKEFASCYAYDVIGELAFDKDLNTQQHPSRDNLPPIPDHILLGSLYGLVPSMMPYSMKIGNRLPIPGLQKLLASRRQLSAQAANWVKTSIEKHSEGDRGSLLASILEARDPDTGARLTAEEICSEAFAFLIAGAHTTSATVGFLFYHLMHNHDAAKKLAAELSDNLPLYQEGGNMVLYAGIESKLPYTMSCIKENFRISAVFNMPMPRLVTDPKGVEICGRHIPQGTSVSMLSHALHHDPRFWGSDHDKFIPERWLEGNISFNEVMPFGVGHRACIGRNIASINLLKVLSTLWRNFEFLPQNQEEILEMESVGVGEKKGPLLCMVRKREK
ncbi:cytochrome P450 [Rhizodiscina lignyota]|uniref:Cytochrome P450 n=1 Tax=Rhizodiscina lignyota TaxID=1504668 RepID=A0A9P4MC91_9PEZI|nr:cytochrome P450 [Rhizodiscina lignyota]